MGTEMPVLETERLVIRPFELADLAAVIRVLDQDTPYPPSSREERAAWLEWTILNYRQLAQLYQPPYGDRAVIEKSSGELVGVVGLVPSLMPFALLPSFAQEVGPERAALSTPEVGLFWTIRSDRRGRGYATEAARAIIDFAFQSMHLRRVVATTEYENQHSAAVMRRLGMRIEQNPRRDPPYMQVVGILDNPSRSV